MKKFIAALLLIALTLTLAACTPNNQEPPEQVKIRVGYMTGPTGMGMAKLISDNGGLENGNERYSFKKYADTTEAKADLAAGNIDVICLPTNEAAQYYAKIDSSAKVLAINCLNSLYLVANADTDTESEITLEYFEGKTIYTCKNGTPRMVLEYILKEAGINATVSYSVDGKEIVTPADLSAQVIAGNIPNAVMPEPIVTNVILNTSSNSDTSKIYSVKIDLADEWEKISDTPITMGCIVADGDFARDHKDLLGAFLAEYKLSVEYISNTENIDSAANYVVETGVMGAAPAAKKALLNLGNSISYLDGEDMKTALIAFLDALGISKPDDNFYYEK